MDDEEILSAAARAALEEARGPGAGHPEPEALLAYHEGTLGQGEREAVQEHLAACAACARVIVDLEDFPDVELVREELRLGEDEVEAAWERLRRAADGEPEGTPAAAVAERRTGRPAPPGRLLRFPAAARLPWALAASLLMATVGLALWVNHLRGELARPRLDVHLADLVPPEVARERGEGAEQLVSVPARAGRVLLLLNLADPRVHPAYEVEIAGADGRTVWRRRGLERSADGTFTLELPRGFLPEGSYRLRVSAASPRGPETVVEYVFAIVYED